MFLKSIEVIEDDVATAVVCNVRGCNGGDGDDNSVFKDDETCLLRDIVDTLGAIDIVVALDADSKFTAELMEGNAPVIMPV